MEPLQRIGKATVDVLEVLLDGTRPRWGLEVIKLTGRPSGSVYPLLDRLERAGWVTSHWDDDAERRGPRRRMYVLTPDGAREAVKACARKSAAEQSRAAKSRARMAAPAHNPRPEATR
ncbi:DNA-binding PadR family transcriptional regulator [Saccharothrix tamanrassetensis]|uniref:DNA-binding PadR family transcriptional regulator n=1 Tax=Saccharothrix tamanrassetensis TaxID=1051531 RepID=A0A841CEZ0_9PSEU|nr:PadR family transcriptional regulator [Saccharothrix tamanrassetensis]MBB5954748.1 DNA-binding PadR family transcriptional regulator [Saccharothrix tamanrassetensis]